MLLTILIGKEERTSCQQPMLIVCCGQIQVRNKLNTVHIEGSSVRLNSENDTVSLQSIAARQDISVGYLEQLMAMMKKAGLVTSSRGASGGYRLGKPPSEISVGDVLRVLEGGLEAVKCGGISTSGACTNSADDQKCQGAELCVAKFVWQRINNSITPNDT